jgi:DNA-binding transcriptional LysR family regulator
MSAPAFATSAGQALRISKTELGLKLFDRVGRRVVLSGEGEQLLGNCRNLLGYARSLAEQAQELRGQDRGLLKVTASSHFIDSVFSTFLHRYAQRYPNVQVRPIEDRAASSSRCGREPDTLCFTIARSPR